MPAKARDFPFRKLNLEIHADLFERLDIAVKDGVFPTKRIAVETALSEVLDKVESEQKISA